MDRLDLMSTFVRIVETGSLSAVARELRTSQPTVSKRLDALERHLGVRLLLRNTTGLRLTEAGERYYDVGRRLVEDFDQLDAAVTQVPRGVQGRLRLNSPVAFGEHVLSLLACEFRTANPQLSISCTFTDRLVDLVEDGVDVAVRMGKVNDPTVVARPLGRLGYQLVASPAYLKRHGTPKTVGDLAGRPYLRYGLEEDSLITPDGARTEPFPNWLALNNTTAVKNAVLAGFGIGRVPRYLVQAELGDKRLREVLPGTAPAPLPLFALFLAGRYVPEKVRAFVTFLSENVQRLPGWAP
jgi:DNA-binding transcriptional LysR family regulator